MALTDLQIANLALSRLGVTKAITTLAATLGDDNPIEDQVASLNYPITRDKLLAEHHWTFATVREEPTADASAERDGWEYVYPLANDLIELQMIWDGSRLPDPKNRVPYDIEHDAANNRAILLTDYKEPVVIYTALIDEIYWPNYFLDALTAELAKKFVLPIAKKPSLLDAYTKEAVIELSKAIAMDLRGIQEDPEPDSHFITGR